jgi:hypothetical protein
MKKLLYIPMILCAIIGYPIFFIGLTLVGIYQTLDWKLRK